MQKLSFYHVKPILLQRKSYPFTTQKLSFYNAKAILLEYCLQVVDFQLNKNASKKRIFTINITTV